MKKLILKIASVVLAFFLGLVFMGYRMSAGNRELMDSMADATLPLVSVVMDGQEYNTMHGYTGEMDGQTIRGDVIPLPEDRKLTIAIDPYETEIQRVCYEVRSLDHTRLIEDTEVGYSAKSGRLEAVLSIVDLLEEGEEYALIIQLETAQGQLISYYTRIANIGETRLAQCLDFAMTWHDATFDKENLVSISQYLESDSSADNDTLEKVTIHSRYKQIIWASMDMQPYSEVTPYVTEIDASVTALRLDFVTQYTGEDKETEYYQVQEYFRIRHTNQRTYLLDYDRTANRIFDGDAGVFGETQLELGILNEDVHYMKNQEENIVAFVQNGELWSYDLARNGLSYVMGFRDGWDARANFGEHDIRIMDIDESGSMNFLVYGYMNRGIHEGESGIAVYHYDAVANTVEEQVFLESRKPYAVLKEELGELAHVTTDEVLYLYLDGSIYAIDLNTRECTVITEGLPEDCYLVSEDQTIMAWQTGDSLYDAKEIYLLNLDTGSTQVITAREGEYVRGLGFMGTDFIWGTATQADIRQDLTGNIVFPMYKIAIQSAEGETIREFAYGEQGKYVVSISVEDNRISLECVSKSESGYVEATPEPITNKTEEINERIVLKTKTTTEKKREYVFAFTDKREAEDPTLLTPKQVLFEGSRAVVPEQEQQMERYYVYGQGRLVDSYDTAREAVAAADAVMGVVTDRDQSLIWNRSGRKTRTQIQGIGERTLQAEETSLEASLSVILNFERVYPDVKQELAEGKNAYDILSGNMKGTVLNLTGCDLSTVLYYVSEGKPVLALTGDAQAVVIVGYDAQNTILLDPDTGTISRMGMNDSTAYFEEAGNLFIGYLEDRE